MNISNWFRAFTTQVANVWQRRAPAPQPAPAPNAPPPMARDSVAVNPALYQELSRIVSNNGGNVISNHGGGLKGPRR